MPAVAIASCQGKRFQHFELTTGGMLKVNDLKFTKDLAYKTQSYCLVVKLQTMTCALEQKYARNPWSYNPRSKRIVSVGLCLTLWLAQSDLKGPQANEHLRREAIKPRLVHRIQKQWNGEGDTRRCFC